MSSAGDESRPSLQCSFCGKLQREVRKLIAGPSVYVCDGCIGLCNRIIAESLDGQQANLHEVALHILEEQHRLLARLDGIARRAGHGLPEPIRGAVASLESATRALESAVAAHLPGVRPADPRDEEEQNRRWRESVGSRVLAAAPRIRAILERRPSSLPEAELEQVQRALSDLTRLARLLEGEASPR